MSELIRSLLVSVGLSVLPVAGVSAATYLFHNDHLGTPQALTDNNQQVVWQSVQNPFGEVSEVVNLVEQNLRFPGQYFDVETGLHYNYHREYDSSLGRYMQSDPIGLSGGLNTYGYVMQNPLSYTDRFGLECNDSGCWPTPDEQAKAAEGDYVGYYELACAGGDLYACRAVEVATNDGPGARWTNNNLLESLKDNGQSDAQCEVLMEQIRKDLAQAHVDALEGATPNSPRVLTADLISDFHESVFDANGAGAVFGGNTLGKRRPGRSLVNFVSRWCVAPSCRL